MTIADRPLYRALTYRQPHQEQVMRTARFPSKYTDGAIWTGNPRRPRADNDNHPPVGQSAATGATVRTPAEHVTIVAASGATTTRVRNWPTATRLKRAGRLDLLAALEDWASMMDQQAVAESAREPVNGDVDRRMETRPSIREIMAAVAMEPPEPLPTASVVYAGGARFDTVHGVCNFYVGGLRFNAAGVLMSWRGTNRLADNEARAVKGASSSVRDVRHLLATDAPVAPGAGFLGGAVGCKGNTSVPAYQSAAVGRHERQNTAEYIRQALPAKNVDILDLAIEDTSARAIGEYLGLYGKAAERKGASAVDYALAQFQTLFAEKLAA